MPPEVVNASRVNFQPFLSLAAIFPTSPMKFNILFLLFPAALAACIWIARDFQGQSGNTFFGMAETEPQTLNFDHDIAVQELRVKTGDLVKKGDTLAIFTRADLDKTEAERRSDIARTETERAAEHTVLEKEKALINAALRAKTSELMAEIRLLRTEDSLRSSYRKNIYSDLPATPENKLVAEKTAAFEKEMASAEAQAREELRLIDTKQTALRTVATAKAGYSQTEIGFVQAERGRLLLLSPIDGYVENLFISPKALVPAHRDLIKINPKTPNRIIGFIHETAEVPFTVGQEVTMVSSSRPEITARGIIIGSNPKMTELPLRLRKFIEVRSWGREIFISLPDDNKFYISEKITITLPLAQ
jgi:multidrug resistance efflux pump